ncbi:phosphoenolpyruvate synthase / pyruvate phosphate dikinase [hydrocarbon metagenome]|uniref:pyruvate, water dikinase n=1 Tax=hydrocarbon metagenome TaxID=938273 RepID=A0A0W8E4W8_9ZZZZ
MTDKEAANDTLIYFLKERAKELDCLYQVDELLNNQRLSLPEIFQEIVKVLPSGWQFPDFCRARIVYDNCSHQTPGFFPSPYSIGSSIQVNDKIVGMIEIVYTQEVPQGEEGFFLEKERKLIRTIADRIGQTILHRQMKQVLLDWNETRKVTSDIRGTNSEWMVIVDLLLRTDHDLLLYVCKKMINHLYWIGIKEAQDILTELSPSWEMSFDRGEVNYPSAKLPPGNIATISEKTFLVASQNMSGSEITLRLNKWLQEQKAYFLIKAIDRIDASVGEIIDAIIRYKNIAGNSNMLNHATERWLEVALMRRFLSDNLDFINVAKKYIGICHYYHIVNRLIFPAESHGKIGGKGTGLFLAQQILKRESTDNPLLDTIKIPKTWYITTDEVTEFLHYNNLESLNEHKYRDLSEIRMDYPNIIQTMKNCKFPPGIVKSLAMALDDFEGAPLIVRSSSLLEDQLGAAFSGKYKSLFLANQGDKKKRLEELMDAIIEVYASVFSPDSIKYRSERGLLDFQEEMGIMIQEVVGTKIGHYFMPLFAGVGFSNNEFRWSPRINREDGLIRLVMGLGTRAVDRLSDDFPVLVSPGQPRLRVNTIPEEIKHYAPKKVDVINLQDSSFVTIEIAALIKEFGAQIPNIQQIVSVNKNDYIGKLSVFDINFAEDDVIVTFDGLISDTAFVKQLALILKTLQDKLGTPVDIEFASDGKDFYLLQCRPQSFGVDSVPAAIPKDILDKDILFSANRYISNGTIQDISHIVYVDPEGYNSLHGLHDLINVGKAVGQLNSLLPKRRFILMGPGRWGSRGDIKMGVQVSYSDINNTAALIEIARKKSNYIPELSFGTHFFQDLVESNIRYLPLYPDNRDIIFNNIFFKRSKNMLAELLPEYSQLEEVVRVIDVRQNSGGRVLNITMNADLEEALGYLTHFSGQAEAGPSDASYMEKQLKQGQDRFDDKFWRWRFFMAERLAERLDPNYFGVKGIYLTGSTNNGTAGPGSDIDLIVHFQGNEQQRQELKQWFTGWSLSLGEMNYLKTGYSSEGLLDIHMVTDEDIEKKSPFAIKIGSITDPAHRLKLKTDY